MKPLQLAKFMHDAVNEWEMQLAESDVKIVPFDELSNVSSIQRYVYVADRIIKEFARQRRTASEQAQQPAEDNPGQDQGRPTSDKT